MRQLVLNIAASLDHFIARPDGSVDWLHAPEYELPNEDYGLGDFYKSIDITLMGNNTYNVVLGFDVPFPYPDKTNFVFTRSEDRQDTEYVTFITGDIVEFVRQLKNEQGKDIWLIGGGQINTLLVNHGLVDKFVLTLIPIMLGEGIPLFKGQLKETKFDIETNRTYDSGLVQLTWKKRK